MARTSLAYLLSADKKRNNARLFYLSSSVSLLFCRKSDVFPGMGSPERRAQSINSFGKKLTSPSPGERQDSLRYGLSNELESSGCRVRKFGYQLVKCSLCRFLRRQRRGFSLAICFLFCTWWLILGFWRFELSIT